MQPSRKRRARTRRIGRTLPLVLVIAVVPAGCDDSTTGLDANTVRVEGTVTRLYEDSVVSGAEIIVDVLAPGGDRAWARDSTDANGTYQLEVPVPGGCEGGSENFTVQATAVDHATLKLGQPASPLVAVCGETTSLDLDLYRNVYRTPQAVAGGLTPSQLSVGWSHACVIAADGAYCWGWSQWGRLGNASVAEDYAESPVPVTNGGGFTQVSVGHNHTCALDGAGAAWCWGDNFDGQAGADTSVYEVHEPSRVQTDLRFVQVQAGRWHSCGLTEAGEVYCWGNEMGTGTGDDPYDEVRIYTTPQPAVLEGTYVAISSQFNSTCALRATGDLYCWGYSGYGELGAGEERGIYTTPLLVVGDHAWKQVDAGDYFTCGITTSDAAYCWGRNVPLGNGVVGDTAAPVEVPGGRAYAMISAGGNTCATTAAGAGYCWGANNVGQLGEVEDPSSAIPVQVAPDLAFTALQAGISYTCGITTDQNLFCWGARKHLGSGRPIRPDGAAADSGHGEGQP